MRKPLPNNRPGRDRWLVSYADFMTLLFGFFVVMYAFAKADQKKQEQIPMAINAAFKAMGLFPGLAKNTGSGPTSNGDPTDIVTSEQARSPNDVKQDLERIKRELAQTLSSQAAAHEVSISMSREGLVISLREAGFFNSGSAAPKPEAMGTLQKIAASLAQVPYDVRVEGHTDNVPIRTAAFNSNWELSAGRATAITRLFLDWHTVPPERLSAAGYGEFHPVASNDTAEGRAENRRVDLVVLPRTSIDFSAPDAQNAAAEKGQWRKVTDGDN